MMSKYSQYFAIEKQLKSRGVQIERSELVSQFTENKKQGLKELNALEYKEFINWLNSVLRASTNKAKDWRNTPENKMRRKIFALFVHKMDYTYDEMEVWVQKYSKFKKKLNDHTYNELVVLVGQAEKTYKSFIQGL